MADFGAIERGLENRGAIIAEHRLTISHSARLVLSALIWGSREVRSRRGLVQATGLSDRQVRDEIRGLVLAGYPVVCGSRSGYSLVNETAQLDREIATLRSREARCRERAEALERVREERRPRRQLRLI